MDKKLDLQYLCTVIGNMAGIPIRIYKNGQRSFFYSFINLLPD